MYIFVYLLVLVCVSMNPYDHMECVLRTVCFKALLKVEKSSEINTTKICPYNRRSKGVYFLTTRKTNLTLVCQSLVFADSSAFKSFGAGILKYIPGCGQEL